MLREFRMVMYTELYLTWTTDRTYCTHREACSALGAAGMAGGLGERGYEDVYGRVPLLLA